MKWSRNLTRVLRDRDGRTLRTLHDAREYVLELDEHHASDRTWQHAAELMMDAAKGGDIEACTRQIELAMFLDARLSLG